MSELVSVWAPLAVIVLMLGLTLLLLRRQNASQTRRMRETSDRNAQALEENTAAIKALTEEMKRSRAP